MEKERFHPIKICCPTCRQEATILSVMFTIRGSICFGLVCVLCGEKMTMKTSWDKIICYCAENEVVNATVFEAVPTLQ